MLVDSSQCECVTKANVCIVGSGIGAGTLALKLAERRISFTIVEAGDQGPSNDRVRKEMVGRNFGLRTTTSIQLGGTSNLWHGILAPLDEIDFERRSWIPYSGWPIAYQDLETHYREAATLLGVEDYDNYDVSTLEEPLRRELDKLVFDRGALQNKIFQQPLPPKNFKHAIVELTRTSEAFHCIYNATALELCLRDEATVDRLKIGTLDGLVKSIEANIFVICAGALETPRLLLNSRVTESMQVGNSGGNVGRFLMDHPMGNLCQIAFRNRVKAPIYSDLKYKPRIKIKSGLEMARTLQEELELPNHNFYVRPSFAKGIDDRTEKVKLSLLTLKDGHFNVNDCIRVAANLNVLRQIVTYKLSLNVAYRYADLFFLAEQIPNPESRVSLSDIKDRFGYPIARVNWQVLPRDIESMRVWFRLLVDRIFPPEYYAFTHSMSDFNWEDIFTSAVHHVGTARMATDERDGVVDKNLKVFGTSNLYVSDGSVFSTAGNVNSSLTISALSCRLAAHLQRNCP